MTATELKLKKQERQALVQQAGAILDRVRSANRTMTQAEDTQFRNLHAQCVTMRAEIVQEEEVQFSNQLSPDHRTAGREDSNYASRSTGDAKRLPTQAERIAFRCWMSGGTGGLNAEQRSVLEAAQSRAPEDEVRALSAVTGSAGGVIVPQSFSNVLDVALKQFGGMLETAEYLPTASGSLMPYPSMNDTQNTAEQTAENTAVSTTTDPTFGSVNFSAFMFDSGVVLIPIQLLQDSAFNPDTWLADALKDRIGRKLNRACTVGAGTTEPKGIVNAATLGITTASATGFGYTELLKTFHSVDPAYRKDPSCAWQFNDTTLLAIRSLLDSNGRPLYIEGGVTNGIDVGVPATLMGKPVVINQDLASIGAGAKPIIFGAMKKYKIRRVQTIQMVRFAELYMATNMSIGFLAYQRFDGNLVDAGTHPVRYMQMAAS